MNDIDIKQLKIEDMIYEVRGHQVNIDRYNFLRCQNDTLKTDVVI